MDAKQFREAAIGAIDDIIAHYETIDQKRVVSEVEPGYLRKLLPDAAPEEGEAWADIQRDVTDKIMPGMTLWEHPNFFAFFPCPTSYPSLLGELYASAYPGAFFNWINSPAATELETVVLDWLAQMLGLPACFLSTGPTNGGGVIQGSASEAVLTAMVAAREKHLRETIPDGLSEAEREDALAHKRSRMVALGSAGAHSSTQKAAVILGLRFRAVPVRAEDGFAMTGAGLAAALDECAAAGLEPFFLTATLGTTDVCAVDDFPGIADALEAFATNNRGEVWVHVDAAYAGAALVLPEVRAALPGGGAGGAHALARFHSFDLNMHKWMLTNFDASCLFFRDRGWPRAALTIHQSVYANAASEGGLVTDYRTWQIPLGRRFRALKVWFVLRSYGVRGVQAYVRRSLALGELFAELLRGRPDIFEIVTGPSFALTVFRVAAAAGEQQEQQKQKRNELTRQLCEAINASGKMWVTGTELDGNYAIRFMTAVQRTEESHVRAAFEFIAATAEGLLKQV